MGQLPEFQTQIVEIDPEEMMFAVQLAQAAAGRRYHVGNPGAVPIIIEDEELGRTTEIRLTDDPMNRAGLAIAQHFEGDSEKAFSCMMRMLAFEKLYRDEGDGRLAKWIRRDESDPEFDEIREEVIALAATFPIEQETVSFDADLFIAELESTVPEAG